MTLQELYDAMGGSYEQALRVLRIDKLIDKHIRKLPDNIIFQNLYAAGESFDPTAIFENAHAIKGVCLNLGLINIGETASLVCEEFRPGKTRCMTDDQVLDLIEQIRTLHRNDTEQIRKYVEGN